MVAGWWFIVFTTSMLPTDAWQISSHGNRAMQTSHPTLPSPQQRHRRRRHLRPSMTTNNNDDDRCRRLLLAGEATITIERLGFDDIDGLERMSKFCIHTFYGGCDNDDDDKNADIGYTTGYYFSWLNKKWKHVKLMAMQKAQLLDISLSSTNEFNRCIVVAVASSTTANTTTTTSSHEIVGCCEVIEERFYISPPSSPSEYSTMTERERSRTARQYRPVIENLCVKQEYRRYGVGTALVRACEDDVRQWSTTSAGSRDMGCEVVTQIDVDNPHSFDLFHKCGYHCLFTDRTCTKIILDNVFFANEVRVTKHIMRKILFKLTT